MRVVRSWRLPGGLLCSVSLLTLIAGDITADKTALHHDHWGDLSCDDEPAPRLACASAVTEFVPGEVYGCEAAWMPTTADASRPWQQHETFTKALGAEVCGQDFHICRHEAEAAHLGLSGRACADKSPPGTVYLSAQPVATETGSVLAGCGSDLRTIGHHQQSGQELNSSLGVFNKGIAPAEDATAPWSVADGSPTPELLRSVPAEWRLSRLRKRQQRSGGLLCCRTATWKFIRTQLATYIAAPDLAARMLTLNGVIEKEETNAGTCILGWFSINLVKTLQICEQSDAEARRALVHELHVVDMSLKHIAWRQVVASGWPVAALHVRLQQCLGEDINSQDREDFCGGACQSPLSPSDRDIACCCDSDSQQTLRFDKVCDVQLGLRVSLTASGSGAGQLEQIAAYASGFSKSLPLDELQGCRSEEPLACLMAFLQPALVQAPTVPVVALGLATMLLALYHAIRVAASADAPPSESQERADDALHVAVLERAQSLLQLSPLPLAQALLCAQGCWPLPEALDLLSQPLLLWATRGQPWFEDSADPALTSRKQGAWLRVQPGRDIASDSLRLHRDLWRTCPATVASAIVATLAPATKRRAEVTMVEVGAATGGCSFLARTYLGASLRGLLVEPHPGNVASLHAAIRLNSWQDTFSVDARAAAEQHGQVALLSQLASAQFSSVQTAAFGFGFADRGRSEVIVDTEPLDTIVAQWTTLLPSIIDSTPTSDSEACSQQLPGGAIDLVVVNTVGSELQVLKGAARLLACGTAKTWAVKVYDLMDDLGFTGAARAVQIAHLFSSSGYDVQRLENVLGSADGRFLVASFLR
eukprot:TRINITY_DN25384_c0_g1_i2.p1 TRINITY_DN25384_c0_g1~~TRINITY_DN25384_c0_g1_i2.p1  ORF type:complete len:820 (+),score=119.14 TRINITY_DN25384_c0_g1_i2:159-2618(+)